jgi:hypothetical protein
MVQFNFSERTIKAKVVYYGPAQSGKTTNLEQIHRLTDPGGQNRLISLNTAQDRTLFFDLLPFSLGTVAGYDFKVQLYTVPGQVQYNATRRVVLAGADAVVFVADSRAAVVKDNLAAFENMKVNLLANRLVPEKVPLVIQYNKQDLPELLSPDELNKALNPWGRRAFPAVASQGKGVLETFVAIVQEMLLSIALKYNLKEKGLDPTSVPQVVQEAFAYVLREAALKKPAPGESGPRPRKVVVSQATDSVHAVAPVSGEAGLVSEELLHRAIRSNVDLAEALSGLVREMNLGLGNILSHAELLLIYKEDAKDKRATAIETIQREATRLRRVVQELGHAGASASRSLETPAPPPPPLTPSEPARATPPIGAERAARIAAMAAAAGKSPAPAFSGTIASAPAPPRAPGSSDTVPRMSAPSPFELQLRQVMESLRAVLDGRGISVDVRIPAGTDVPRCPPDTLQHALAGLLERVATLAPHGSALVLRSEKKPVLLRRGEEEVKQEFLMFAVGQPQALPGEDQQALMQGAGPGPVGATARLIRDLGGFVRFAPLPGGGFESRVFLPGA